MKGWKNERMNEWMNEWSVKIREKISCNLLNCYLHFFKIFCKILEYLHQLATDSANIPPDLIVQLRGHAVQVGGHIVTVRGRTKPKYLKRKWIAHPDDRSVLGQTDSSYNRFEDAVSLKDLHKLSHHLLSEIHNELDQSDQLLHLKNSYDQSVLVIPTQDVLEIPEEGTGHMLLGQYPDLLVPLGEVLRRITMLPHPVVSDLVVLRVGSVHHFGTIR